MIGPEWRGPGRPARWSRRGGPSRSPARRRGRRARRRGNTCRPRTRRSACRTGRAGSGSRRPYGRRALRGRSSERGRGRQAGGRRRSSPSANIRNCPRCFRTKTSSSPGPGVDRVGRVARPVQAVGRGGVAEELGGRTLVVVAGVPEVEHLAVAEDVPALPDLSVPGVAAGALKDRIGRGGRPGNESPGELVGPGPGRLRPPGRRGREGSGRRDGGKRLRRYPWGTSLVCARSGDESGYFIAGQVRRDNPSARIASNRRLDALRDPAPGR